MALTWVGVLPAQAQRVSVDAALHTMEKPYVQAMGEATISAKPDQAVLEIAVVSEAATAVAAAAQNAKQMDTVLADLSRLPGSNRKLRTTSYSVRPKYQYPKPGAAPVIAGYTASNVVEVTLEDLTLVSKIIDAATRSGANVVQKLQYQLKNPGAVRAQALRQAAEQARISAEAMAAGLGLKILRVLSVEDVVPEGGFNMYRKATPAAMAAAAPATPLEVGMIEVAVDVMLKAEIGQ